MITVFMDSRFRLFGRDYFAATMHCRLGRLLVVKDENE